LQKKHWFALVRSWLILHHADRFAMGKAGKARKAGKAQGTPERAQAREHASAC